ncbi:MAG: radical SAM protein [Candidatus Omnitrophica bacterium]|nr:radical SAM protein [Candidatus Omnitrophota bacterium]
MKHYTIPFFITHKGCPFKCIFCDQKHISGSFSAISPIDINKKINSYLKTFPKNSKIEAGFFGGTFTGLKKNDQEKYLKTIQPFIRSKKISGIRLSTRPDYINQDILSMLKKYHVTTIELGVQSMDNNVLTAVKRGHCFNDIKTASELILKNKFVLAHQLMVGLPKSSLSKEIKSANLSIDLKASEVRIYPLIVIKNTALADMYQKQQFSPLSLQTAIKRCSKLIKLFEQAHIKILRCGLHPVDTLTTDNNIIAGPFHPAFRQLVDAHIYKNLLKKNLSKTILKIYYNPEDTSYVIGPNRKNAFFVEKFLKTANIFTQDRNIKKNSLCIQYKNGTKKTVFKYD